MEELPPDIAHDVGVSARNYSQFRSIHRKWRCGQEKALRTLSAPVVVHTGASTLVQIQKPGAAETESYMLKALSVRAAIKRSLPLFQAMLHFWQDINPFGLTSISRSLYLKLNDFLYAESGLLDEDIDHSEFLKQDAAADFRSHQGLTFCEYYDSLFEFLDTLTKTQLVSEYVRLFRMLANKIRSSSLLQYFNFAAKSHVQESPRARFHGWMHENLKQLSALRQLKGMEVSSPIKLSTKTLPRRQPAKAVKQVPQSLSDVTLKKIERLKHLSQTTTTRTFFRPKQPLWTRQKQKMSSDRPSTRMLQAPPKRLKPSKSTSLLEQVIVNRKKYFEALPSSLISNPS